MGLKATKIFIMLFQVAVKKNTHLEAGWLTTSIGGRGGTAACQNWITIKKNGKMRAGNDFTPFTAWSGDHFGPSHTTKCDQVPNKRNWLSGDRKGQKSEV